MTAITIALPVLPGKAEQARRWGREKMGPRRAELDASNRHIGVSRESWHLAETARGPLLLGAFEADDPAGSFAAYAAADGAYERWEKREILELTGVDLGQPMAGPPPELLVEWRAGG